MIRIYYQGEEIALHLRSNEKGVFTTVPGHYPRYKQLTSTEYQENYQCKMEKIGSDAGRYFRYLLEKYPKNWNRPVQGILSLAKNYPQEVINRSCKRAQHFDASGYRVIKNICENGSYKMPLENGGKR